MRRFVEAGRHRCVARPVPGRDLARLASQSVRLRSRNGITFAYFVPIATFRRRGGDRRSQAAAHKPASGSDRVRGRGLGEPDGGETARESGRRRVNESNLLEKSSLREFPAADRPDGRGEILPSAVRSESPMIGRSGKRLSAGVPEPSSPDSIRKNRARASFASPRSRGRERPVPRLAADGAARPSAPPSAGRYTFVMPSGFLAELNQSWQRLIGPGVRQIPGVGEGGFRVGHVEDDGRRRTELV